MTELEGFFPLKPSKMTDGSIHPVVDRSIHPVVDGSIQAVVDRLQVQLNTMRWAMIAHLRRPPPGFEQAVRHHFHLLRGRIMRTAARWLAAAADLAGVDDVGHAPLHMPWPPPLQMIPHSLH